MPDPILPPTPDLDSRTIDTPAMRDLLSRVASGEVRADIAIGRMRAAVDAPAVLAVAAQQLADEPSVPPKPHQSPVADLSRDGRTDRITTAIANTAECADITVTVREADGTEVPLRRLARCLDGAGLIDHEGI